MINMVGDNMVPMELGQAEQVTARLKNATYLEIKEESEIRPRSARRDRYDMGSQAA